LELGISHDCLETTRAGVDLVIRSLRSLALTFYAVEDRFYDATGWRLAAEALML